MADGSGADAQGRSAFLQLFWDLASVEESERRAAVETLTTSLAEDGDAVSGSGGGASDDGPGFVGNKASKRLVYTVNRLLAGISSGRAAARQGFATALAAVARAFDDQIPLKELAECLLRATAMGSKRARKGMRGHEQRDLLFGRVFGIGALARSGRLARPGEEVAHVASTMLKEAAALLDDKRWLRPVCCEIVSLLISSVSQPVLDGSLCPVLAELSELCPPLVSDPCTPEQLCVAATLVGTYRQRSEQHRAKDAPECVLRALQLLSWVDGGLRSAEQQPAVREALLEATGTYPVLHPAWTSILDLLVGGSSDAVSPGFGDFWQLVVNDSLLASTHERRATAFSLCQHLLATADLNAAVVAQLLPMLLSPTLLRCLSNNLPASANYLHRPAHRLVGALSAAAKADESRTIAPAALSSILTRDPAFDSHTRTTLVASLQALLDEDDMQKHVMVLYKVFENPGDGLAEVEDDAAVGGSGTEGDSDSEDDMQAARQRAMNSRQVWALDGLCAAVRTGSLSEDHKFIASVLRFLTVTSFFVRKDAEEELADDAVRGAARTRLLLLLSELTARDRSDARSQAARLAARWALSVFDEFSTASASSDLELASAAPIESAAAASAEAAGAARVLYNVAQLLEAEKDAQHSRRAGAFASLLAHVAVVLLTEALDDDERPGDADAAEGAEDLVVGLEDLQQCMLRLCAPAVLSAQKLHANTTASKTPKRKKKSKRRGSVASATDVLPGGDLSWSTDKDEVDQAVAVFTDTLLSLLARPSALLRDACKTAFREFAELLTEEALDTLMNVVHGPEGLDALLSTGGDGEESDSDGDGASMDGDAIAALHTAVAAANGSKSSSKHVDEGDSGSDSDNNGSDSGSASDGSEDGTQDGSGDEESSDEDISAGVGPEAAAEMKRYDGMIANMLRMRKEQRQQARAVREQNLHFRYRALDLVEIAITRLGGQPLVLRPLMPMLRALRACAVRLAYGSEHASDITGLQQRVRGVFNRLCRTKLPHATEDGEGLPVSQVYEDLEAILGMAWGAPSAAFVDAAQQAVWVQLRVLKAGVQDETARGNVLDEHKLALLLGKRMSKYLRKKNAKLSGKFFQDLCRRVPFVIWHIAGDIAEAAAGEAPSVFRRVEAFDLIGILSSAATQAQSSRKSAVVWSKAANKAVRVSTGPLVDSFAKTVKDAATSEGKGYNAKRLRAVLASGMMLMQLPGAAQHVPADFAEHLQRLATATASGAVRSLCSRCIAAAKASAPRAAAAGAAKTPARASKLAAEKRARSTKSKRSGKKARR